MYHIFIFIDFVLHIISVKLVNYCQIFYNPLYYNHNEGHPIHKISVWSFQCLFSISVFLKFGLVICKICDLTELLNYFFFSLIQIHVQFFIDFHVFCFWIESPCLLYTLFSMFISVNIFLCNFFHIVHSRAIQQVILILYQCL